VALEALPTGGASAVFSIPSHGARSSGHRLDRAKFQFDGSPKNMSEKTQKFQTNKHTMWIGNVRNLSFQDQLRATIAVDLNELSMTPLDFDRNLAKGLSARDMRMMAADAGVSLPILDPMASWAPRWRSGISDAAWMEFLGYSADDFFRIAEQLGVSTMTVIGTFQPGLVAIPETAESFALLADKARSHGLHCVLEFIPLWGIGDLASAWQILQIANRPNTGLAFDFWHYIRGGRDDALLRSIPGSKISYVQVTDAEGSLPTGRSLFDDCLFHRLPPGQGGLPIKQLLDILCEIGGIERLGPEVFSAKLDASSAEEIGQALREPYWQALADSGIG
jgi:sugar phosphate isomerase/epimerase